VKRSKDSWEALYEKPKNRTGYLGKDSGESGTDSEVSTDFVVTLTVPSGFTLRGKEERKKECLSLVPFSSG
jgi:hypothetical protein